MTTHQTAIYVEHTGHVLSAFSRVANPSGEFSDIQKANLLNAGVRVRQLTPPPPRLPFLLAAPRRHFRLDYPIQNFIAQLGRDLNFTASRTLAPAPWLVFNPTTVSFAGEPSTTNTGELTEITITATQRVGGNSKSEQFKLKVASPPFAINDVESFLLPSDQLNLFSDKVSADIICRPRSYQFRDGALVLLPDPAERRKLTFALTPSHLVVKFQADEPEADKDIPMLAIIRRTDQFEQINSGVISNKDSSGSIGFTLNAATTYKVLLLVSGYDPFSGVLRVGDPAVEWPSPI